MSKVQEKPKTSLVDLSFEQALKELEAIVRRLENGSSELEMSINDYIHGTELKEFCLDKLKTARLQVESILKTQNNGQESLELQPFDAN